jgi:aminoglycoside phosphotransferase (APT) family kinase protein
MQVVDHAEDIRLDFDILPSPTVSTSTSSSEEGSSIGYAQAGEMVYRETMRQCKTIDLKKLALLAQKVKGNGTCEVLYGMTQIGASNIIMFLAFDDDTATRWVVRFPTVGPLGLTPDYDMLAELIESMVTTMGYVSAHTSLPVPAIHGWSSSCNNELGRPYVIMDAAKGNSLYELQNAGFDLDEVVDRLSSFVDQWAQYIAELATLQFEQIGSLAPDSEGDVAVGPLLNYFNIRCAPMLENDVFRGPFNSAADHLLMGSHLIREASRSESSNSPLTYQKFLHLKLLESLFSFYVDPTLLTGPFVLSHIDFDIQNILIDEKNNFKITGIVDWDLAAVLPLQSHLRVPDILMCDQWTKTRQTNREIKPWQLKFAEKYRDHFKWCLIKHLREKGLDFPASNLLESSYMFGRFQRAISEEPEDDMFDEIWSHIYGTEVSWKDILKSMQTADWGTVVAERLSLPVPTTETEPEPQRQVDDTRTAAIPSRPATTDTFWNDFKQTTTWRARMANKLRWGWWHIERCVLCQLRSNRISFLDRQGFSEMNTSRGAGGSFKGGEKTTSGGTGKESRIKVDGLTTQEERKRD